MKEVGTQTEGGGQALAQRRKRGFASVPALRRQQAYYGVLFVIPGLIIYMIFMIYPFLNTIYLSFTDWNGVAPSKDWVGLSNYVRMFGDDAALKAFANNIVWVL